MAFFNREYFAKLNERVRIGGLELAKSKGFSTLEEYQGFDKQQFQEGRAPYDAFLDVECKRRGILREQLDAEDPQRPRDKPECNCDGHLNPFFCPERLITYNSMVEGPFGLLKYSHPPQLERLHMKEDDKSKRLSEEDLERYWGMDSQKIRRKLPRWAKRDPVIKKITTYEIEHSSVPPSCSTESISTPTPSRFRSPTVQTTDESDTKVASKNSTLPHVQLPRLNPIPSFPNASSSKMRKSKQQPQTKTADTSCLSLPPGVQKRGPKVSSRIHKVPSHTMQTRSRDALTFYALDSHNRTTSFRKARRRTKSGKGKLL
ncbi:hypothetical protein MMC07_000723 [Pseudocyphellaria aurata]|nr:hypothetical protein [Pseudocyphellaria aurata]